MTTFLCFALCWFSQTPEASLRVRARPNQGREIVAQLPGDSAAKLLAGRWTQEQGEAVLIVSLLADGGKTVGPAMLGKYERQGSELVFTPRFPLDPGQTYRARLKHDDKTESMDFRMPLPSAKAAPSVRKIYPTADVLPANHLKFHVYFDRPMRGGNELFKQIALVDEKGNEIDDPWLLDEIWNEEENCLIIYIHPGRIKWGVILRELLGPVLYEKREYSLVIRGTLTDLEGNKIGKDVVKKFRTVAEDRVRIELNEWKLSPPKAFSREPLTLTFPKSLDHRSLQRFLAVRDDKGNRIAGTATLGKEEKSWHFIPAQPWQERGYRVDVSGELEDVAGNNPLRPFDFDLSAPKMPAQRLQLEFRSTPGVQKR